MDMMQLYREKLLDHYHHPRNKGTLQSPDFAGEEVNPSCGDQIHLEGLVNDTLVEKLMFTGTGCVISQAGASLLTEYAQGKTIDHLLDLRKEFMFELVGIPLGPTRMRCALISLYAMQHALLAYKKELEHATE